VRAPSKTIDAIHAAWVIGDMIGGAPSTHRPSQKVIASVIAESAIQCMHREISTAAANKKNPKLKASGAKFIVPGVDVISHPRIDARSVFMCPPQTRLVDWE